MRCDAYDTHNTIIQYYSRPSICLSICHRHRGREDPGCERASERAIASCSSFPGWSYLSGWLTSWLAGWPAAHLLLPQSASRPASQCVLFFLPVCSVSAGTCTATSTPVEQRTHEPAHAHHESRLGGGGGGGGGDGTIPPICCRAYGRHVPIG